MGLLPSRRSTMNQMVLYLVLAVALTNAAVQFRTFEANNPFPFGGFHNLLSPSSGIQWPNFIPVREATRSSRQFDPNNNNHIADASFIPLGNNLPLEPEHRAVEPTSQPQYIQQQQYSTDPAPPQPTEAPEFPPVPSSVPSPPPLPVPAALVQQSLPPPQQQYQPQPQQLQPQFQQFQPPPQPQQYQPQQPAQPFRPQPLESPRPPYGAAPTGPFAQPQPQQPQQPQQQQPAPHRNHESPVQNLLVWPTRNQQQQQQQQQQQPQQPISPVAPPQPPQPAQERAGYRNSYGSSRPSVFDNSPTSTFAHRSFQMPPSPAELGFPSVSNTQENWNYDVNWAEFGRRKRKRRSSPQRPNSSPARRQQPTATRRQSFEEDDNIALEDRRTIETRIPAPSRPRPSERERHEREGAQHKQEKQEYDGPYVYTQLFGPPYEVGYIRSPIPSKHVYEDYLQFVRSWSSASREAVDDQLRSNPSALKNYASSKYTETSPSYKETAPSKDSYKEPEYKEPAAPAYSKEPEYREPAFKGPSPSYKEPAYKDPAPVYREPEYKEPEYKEPAYANSAPSYKEPEPAYKEPEYKAPPFKGQPPAYKEPAYSKEPEYKEPAYKEPASAPAYKEEDAYRGQTSTEPVFRGETYRDSFKETAHKSPNYKEESYQAPDINYHSPKGDYVAPDTEFRPTGRPAFHAAGPKSPVYMERDFVPIKNQNGPALYDTPTTYRPATATRDSYSDAPATYDILKPFEKARPSNNAGYSAAPPSYDPPTAVYEPVTAKYKPVESASYEAPSKGGYDAPSKGGYEAPKTYDTPAYEVPKRYQTPPERDGPKNYEAPPPRNKPSPSVAYYQPPTRYVEPPQYGNSYKTGGSYETSSAKYESPAAQSYDSPASAGYDAPKKGGLYETSTKYAEAALYISTTARPSAQRPETGYRIEPLTTPAYKEPAAYPADDYAPSGYKDDVELSSTSYQAVSQNYDNTPKDEYQQPPTAYDQVRKPDDSGYLPSKESYPASSSSYGDEPKKADDGYSSSSDSASSAPGYEASTGKKKHYPVIIGRYQVTDSSAFLPKKVEGSGGQSVGSHVHGSNGDEYVVYYLPYGQPLPIPVRKRRSAIEIPEEPVYTVRRYRNLAEGKTKRTRGQKRQQLEEQQVLSPEEAHKLLKFPVPYVYRKAEAEEEAAADEASTNPSVAPVVESQDVAVGEGELSPVVEDDRSAPVEVQEEIVAQVQEVVQDEDVSPPHVEQVEQEPIAPQEPVEDAQEETTPEAALPLVAEEPEHQIVAEETPSDEAAAPVQDEILAQIEEDVAKGALIPLEAEGAPESAPVHDEPSSEGEKAVGEIIIVKEVEVPVELENEPVAPVEEGGVANVSLITEQEEQEVVEPPAVAQVAFITHEESGEQADPPVHYKKKKPAVIDAIPVLPGLTQRPVKYLRPPGIAADPQQQWNGYSTWWTKIGNRVAKIYNYE